MPHDSDWDDEYSDGHLSLIGAVLVGIAVAIVLNILWWAVTR